MRRVAAALAAALAPARLARGAPAARRRTSDVARQSLDEPPRLPSAPAARSLRDRRPRCEEIREERAKFPRLDARGLHEGPGPLAGQLLTRPPRRAAQGDRARSLIDDRTGAVLEAWTGFRVAVDDGARLRRRVRAQGQRAVRVDPAAACRSSCRSSTRAGRARWLHLDLLVLAGFSLSLAFFNAGDDRDVGPARLPAARLPAGAHAVDRAAARPAAATRRRGCSCRSTWLAVAARLPRRLPRRPERHRARTSSTSATRA